MITEPKNLTEQILNLVERIATEMKALYATLETKLSATEAADTYATKSTTYTKPEIDEKLKNVSTDDHAVLIQQYIAFYNGYMGTNLDYREYLSCNNNEAVNQLYAFANAYNG